MIALSDLATALTASLQDEPTLMPGGAEALFVGMVALTAIAGWLDVAQQLKGGAAFPVPLVVYATMLPVLTFIVVLLHVKGEGAHLGLYLAALSALPLVVVPRLRTWRRRGRESSTAG